MLGEVGIILVSTESLSTDSQRGYKDRLSCMILGGPVNQGVVGNHLPKRPGDDSSVKTSFDPIVTILNYRRPELRG